jgi:hypothetical protein
MENPDHNSQQVPKQVESPESTPPKKGFAAANWPLGLAIVAIGGLLLARNLGFELFFLDFHNWWAFFILLAAIGPLQQALSAFLKEGFGAAVANSLVSAGAIIFVALIFLLDLSFYTWWPVFIMIGGLYMMTSRDRH